MATVKEKKLAKVIDDRVPTNLGQVSGTMVGRGIVADVTSTVPTVIIARSIIDAGYVDKEEVYERITRDSRVLETKIGGKPFWIISDSLLRRILDECMKEDFE